MKKYLIILIAFSLCVSIVSCDVHNPKDTAASEILVTETNATETQFTEILVTETNATETQFTENQEEGKIFPFDLDENNNAIGINGHFFSDQNPLTITSYNMYQEFIKRVNLPQHFITYKNLSVLGNFYIFVHYGTPLPLGYKRYKYGFMNGSTKVDLQIIHDSETSIAEELIGRKELNEEEINPSEMRRVYQEDQSHYYYKGIYFHYSVGGKLSYIEWESGKIRYILSAGVFFYPQNESDESEFLHKFQSPDTALELIKSFAPPDVEE